MGSSYITLAHQESSRRSPDELKLGEAEFGAGIALSLPSAPGFDPTTAIQFTAQDRDWFRSAWRAGIRPDDLTGYVVHCIELV